jgi:hypothetical protein
MSLPLPARTRLPIVVPKTLYNATGVIVSFDDPGTPVHEQVVSVSIMCYSGVALVNLDGLAAGPFIELPAGSSFDFEVATQQVFVKASGGTCEIAIVAAKYEDS